MADIQIADAHREHVARMQHVLEWLQAERARLADELRVLTARGASVQSELLAFVQQEYHVPAGVGVTFDSAQGVISIPDIPVVITSASNPPQDTPQTAPQGDDKPVASPDDHTPIPLSSARHSPHTATPQGTGGASARTPDSRHHQKHQ